MDTLQLILLAIIQGITEFLPISSSAHLILPHQVLSWEDQGLAFDVAVHVGSLIAVVVYFRRDIIQLTTAWFGSLGRREQTPDSRLAWYVIAATIPAGLAGLIFHDFIEQHLRSITVIAITTVLFGLLLGWSDLRGARKLTLRDLTLGMAVFVGCAQALALIPGTSRSGITITAGLLLGLQREDCARFSFLLSIPIISLSGGFKAYQLLESGIADWQVLFWGSLLAGVSAYLCINLFLSFINRIGMMPFVIYRLGLGAVLAFLVWYQ